ncbi:TolC family outer membrane protein [Cobetia amphilecti]|uniref:TolC family outer membrane protein n=1 Tax=Cobetia amphilecti TaxID=1055104 RepID=A0ABT6UNQ3_9GAMM|nr:MULTISPECIES: TolC family outer membrane protein [Cobetia]MDI5884031.1 TolC family outer membrane protein [Cobetia amphilecti]MDO6816312.1 TolC family outer membrane protein [Cobetia amphilecti]WOI25351.1 TolC family outer membrane protein [Cobetia amphilecti]BBO57350.1 channel protein TolC [Cobetia sp. AM6]
MANIRILPLVLAMGFATQAQAANLLDITRDALTHNASLSSSRSLYQSVEDNERIELADLLPQITATGTVSRTDVTGNSQSGTEGDYTDSNIVVNVNQQLFDAADWYELATSKDTTRQQKLLLDSDQQQLLYDVASAYFTILNNRDVLDARIAQEKAFSRQLDQANQQFEVGLIAITDVQEAKASFDDARAQRIAAEADLQVSFEALQQLTGQQYDSIDGLEEDLAIEAPVPASRGKWVEMALSNNPLIGAAQKGVDVARGDVKTSRAGHLPEVGAFATYSYDETDIDTAGGYQEYNQIGIQASLPIYTGGRTSAQVRQSTHLLEQSQYDLLDQQRSTTQSVRSLYSQVRSDVLTVKARKQAIVSSRSALEATRSGYEVGTRNIVDVLDAEQALYQALADYASSRYTYVLDLLNLRQAAGIIDINSVRDLNESLKADRQVSLVLNDESPDELENVTP